jgi:hypothetical protein
VRGLPPRSVPLLERRAAIGSGLACCTGLQHARPDPKKKCTEPVTPSSGFPTDLRRSDCLSGSHQPRTLRTRCNHHPRGVGKLRQGRLERTLCKLRSFLFAQIRTAINRVCSGHSRRPDASARPQEIRRAGNAFVHLPDEPSASA